MLFVPKYLRVSVLLVSGQPSYFLFVIRGLPFVFCIRYSWFVIVLHVLYQGSMFCINGLWFVSGIHVLYRGFMFRINDQCFILLPNHGHHVSFTVLCY